MIIGIRTQGAKDKGLLGTTDNLEDAQADGRHRTPSSKLSRLCQKPQKGQLGKSFHALSAQGAVLAGAGPREGKQSAGLTPE